MAGECYSFIGIFYHLMVSFSGVIGAVLLFCYQYTVSFAMLLSDSWIFLSFPPPLGCIQVFPKIKTKGL
jgi:hypothetical protein